MLLHCEPIANEVDLVVPVEPLFVGQSNPMRPLIHFHPHNLTDPRGLYQRSIGLITSMKEEGIQPSRKQSHPRLSILIVRYQNFEDCCVQSAIVLCPWLSK